MLLCRIQLSCEACKFAKVKLSCLIHPLSTQNTPPSTASLEQNCDSFSFLDSCSFSGYVVNKKRAFSYFRYGLHSVRVFTTRCIGLFRCDVTGERKVSRLRWQPAEWLVGCDISGWRRGVGGRWDCWRQIRAMCHWATAPRHSRRLLLAGISSERERENNPFLGPCFWACQAPSNVLLKIHATEHSE